MVLEGGVAVGHGGMPGVAGLGEQAEVREAEAAHQEGAGLPPAKGWAFLAPGMKEHAKEQG